MSSRTGGGGSGRSISGVARSRVSLTICSGVKGHSEQGLRHLRHFELLFVAASAACHRGGGSDTEDVVAEGVAASANEHRDIGALTPAIGMQLVEDEELEALGGSHQLAVLASREQKLQHHVVGEKNVRGVGPDGVASFAPLLPGIAGEANQALAFRVTPVDELPELLAPGCWRGRSSGRPPWPGCRVRIRCGARGPRSVRCRRGSFRSRCRSSVRRSGPPSP